MCDKPLDLPAAAAQLVAARIEQEPQLSVVVLQCVREWGRDGLEQMARAMQDYERKKPIESAVAVFRAAIEAKKPWKPNGAAEPIRRRSDVVRAPQQAKTVSPPYHRPAVIEDWEKVPPVNPYAGMSPKEIRAAMLAGGK